MKALEGLVRDCRAGPSGLFASLPGALTCLPAGVYLDSLDATPPPHPRP